MIMTTWEVPILLMGVLLNILAICAEGKHNTIKGCPQGCLSCSSFNGCITCKPQYFLLLYRNGMKHIGICTHACPTGYYPDRVPDNGRCLKCHVDNCDVCYARKFCAKCNPGFYSHRGNCYERCPEGMYGEKRTGDCKPITDCEVEEWNVWGPCMRDGKTCGRKWGEKIRTRDVNVFPTKGGLPCPVLLEAQKCKINPRFCPEPTESPDKEKDKEDSKIKKKKNKRQRRRRKRKRKGKEKVNSRTKGSNDRDDIRTSTRTNKNKSRDRTSSLIS